MTPSGIEPATFRFVAQHFNHCATVVPTTRCSVFFIYFKKKVYVLLRLNQALGFLNFEPVITSVNRKIGTCSLIGILAKPPSGPMIHQQPYKRSEQFMPSLQEGKFICFS